MKIVNRNAKANLILSRFVFCAMIVFLYSCGSGGSDGSGGSSGVGSIAFGLTIKDDQQAKKYMSRQTGEDGIDCDADDISRIEATVSDENDLLLARGAWDCKPHQGTIDDILAGSNRKLDLIAKNSENINVYSAEVTGITVLAGQTTALGFIELDPNKCPEADAGTDRTAQTGDTVRLDGSGSTDINGNELTYSWSFFSVPEGSEALLDPDDPTDPIRTFVVDVPGDYVAQLIVNDGICDSEPDTTTINWLNSCPVSNAGADRTAQTGDTVSLNGSGSTDIDGDEITYSWSLLRVPEGSEALLDPDDPTEPNRTFVVDVPGIYVAELIVNDGICDSEPDTTTINWINTCPVSNAGTDRTAQTGDTVSLNGSGSTDIDGDEITYSWSLLRVPEGSEAELSDPTEPNPSFVVDVPGDYVAQLIVNDGICDSEPDTTTINWLNTCPVSNAGADRTAQTGDTVTLNGSGSTDIDGDEITYSWSLLRVPEGSEAELSDPTEPNPSFVVDVPGDYVAQLIVNDGICDSEPDTTTINWLNTCPVSNAGADRTAQTGDTVTLNGSGSTDIDGDEITYFWSLLRVPEGSEAELSDPTALDPSFVVDVPGDYVAQLIVNDGICDSEPDTVTIDVEQRPM